MTPELMQKLREMMVLVLGLSIDETKLPFHDDMIYFYDKLSTYLPFFINLVDNRKIALIYMCFDLGIQEFLKLTNIILSLESQDYKRTAYEILKTKYAENNLVIVNKIASIIETGEL